MLEVQNIKKGHRPVKRFGNIFFDLIRKIEEIEDDFDYVDINVEPDNVFMANGILSHNSGTVPEECAIFHRPCVQIRQFTERQELVENGSLILSGTETEDILRAYNTAITMNTDWADIPDYFKLNVSDTVVRILTGKI
jgi:UDP-N-acetylglucosamine 2-epimerase